MWVGVVSLYVVVYATAKLLLDFTESGWDVVSLLIMFYAGMFYEWFRAEDRKNREKSMTTKSIEDIVKELGTDVHYIPLQGDYFLVHANDITKALTSFRNATIEECVEALPNEVIVEEVDEGAGFVPNTSDEAIADRSRNWIISEARQSLTALKSKEEKI